MVATPLNLANHPTHKKGPWLHTVDWIEKHAWYYGITTEFCRFDSLAWESCIIQFPTTPPCSTEVNVLETGEVPILFSLSQMKNLGMTIELDPPGDTITCPAFGLCSSPAQYSTMGHVCWTGDSFVPANDQVA